MRDSDLPSALVELEVAGIGEARTGTLSAEGATDFATKFPPRVFGIGSSELASRVIESSAVFEFFPNRSRADIRRRQYGSNAGGEFRYRNF